MIIIFETKRVTFYTLEHNIEFFTNTLSVSFLCSWGQLFSHISRGY